MNYVTIRRNATKKIANLLSQALVISGTRYDDMEGISYYFADPATVLENLDDYSRIYARAEDDGRITDVTFSRYSGSLTAWLDIEKARATLYMRDFARLFPNDPQSIEYAAKLRAEAEAAEQARKAAELEEQRWLENQPEPLTYSVGDTFIARFASLNKRNTAEEYLAECVKPAKSDNRNCSNWYENRCRVEKVLRLTPAEFAHLSNNLMEYRDDLGEGGTGSDAAIDLCGRAPWQLSEEERKQYIDQSWSAVTVVLCDGCRPLVIDPQGYKYARYVGLYPRPEARVIPKNVIAFPISTTTH